MDEISQFRDISAWKTALGLLPIPLYDSLENQDQYVLLNGTAGNFCLDFQGDMDLNSRRATAWSCDVGHYVMFTDDSVVVNRWEKGKKEEKYSRRSVINQLHQFHQHLEKTEPDRSQSITAHVLRIYRRIRSVVEGEDNGLHSLSVLLHLLASVAAEQNRLIDKDLEFWGLTPEIAELSRTIPDATWDPLYQDLSGFGRYEVLRPNYKLLLRHATGAIFQDAHLEVNNSPTLWLPGFELPAKIGARETPKEIGAYFTPPVLARTLAEEATRNIQTITDGELVLFDPACGSGELLKECLRLLKLRDFSGSVRVIGWDKSQAAIDMARFVLAWEKRSWFPHKIKIEIKQCDSVTTINWPNNIDILLMNPPFKSWQRMGPEEKEAVRTIMGPTHKPNLAMVFARRALAGLRKGGVLAMIAPNSLFEAASGKYTREAMAKALNPQLVARLGDQNIFSRALVDAGIYVGRRKSSSTKKKKTEETAILWSDFRQKSLNRALRGLRKWRGAESEPLKEEGFSIYLRKDFAATDDPWVARGYDAWALYQSFQNNKKMLPANKVFDIKQGSRLGSDVFIVPREYVQRLDRKEQHFFRPAVMNPSIDDARLIDTHYAFYPYTTGLLQIITEKELKENVPQYFQDYLLPAKATLKSRKTLEREKGLKWWDLLWHRPWQTDRNPKLVSKYFGGNRSFAFDKTGDFVAVVGHAWLLKKGAIALGITDEDIYLATLTYLNSTIAHDLLQYVSIQVSGGQLNLSNKYASNLLVPNLAKLPDTDLNELIQTGIKISNGQFEQWADVDEMIFSILSR